MLKPILGVAATGLIAVLLGKVLLVFLLPFIGIAAGFLLLVVKVVFVAVMVCVAIWLGRRLARRAEKPA
jgi:membrane protein implicated in regulation of membrane protease activity